MHSPSAHALRHLDRFCIVLVCTLKHVSPATCVITITYCTIQQYGTSSVMILERSSWFTCLAVESLSSVKACSSGLELSCGQYVKCQSIILILVN